MGSSSAHRDGSFRWSSVEIEIEIAIGVDFDVDFDIDFDVDRMTMRPVLGS